MSPVVVVGLFVLSVNLFTSRSAHLAATCSLFSVECERDAQTGGVAVVT